jgi:hypothetical protein
MKKILLALFLISISPLSHAALDSADDDAIETYSAELGEEDYFNSNGTRLKTVAAILQQDRANVHEAIAMHRGDSTDSFFENKSNRMQISSMLNNGYISEETKTRILNGWPAYVTVSIHRNSIDVE